MDPDIEILGKDAEPESLEGQYRYRAPEGFPLVLCLEVSELDAQSALQRLRGVRAWLAQLAQKGGAAASPAIIVFGTTIPPDAKARLHGEGVPAFEGYDATTIEEKLEPYARDARETLSQIEKGEAAAWVAPGASGQEQTSREDERAYAEVLAFLQPKDWREREY